VKPFNPPLADWQGKTAWIVGASSGIGRATALALLEGGARVAVSARNGEALDELAALHNDAALPPRVIVLPLDVCDAAAVAAAYAQLQAMAGTVDLVLFNAATYGVLRADAFALDEMLRHQQVNYVGALHVLDGRAARFAGAGRGPPEPAGQRGRLPRAAQGPGVRPDQGRADQPGRGAVPGSARARHRREPGESRAS
jgi:NAD(P)-dependent dehydrogenase (short-subunit alcohol dehydrogenase family)